MLHKIINWYLSHRDKITAELTDYTISLSLSIGSVFTLQNLFDWFIHTLGACASTLIVSLVLYFVMRKIKKMFP